MPLDATSLSPSPKASSTMASDLGPEKKTVRTGSCLCREVQYEVVGDPLAFRICHCINCRKVTGSAFMANAFFSVKGFNVTRGKENLRAFVDTNTASGIPINRWFCAGCGANIYMQSTDATRAKVIVIQSGGIDGNVVSEWVPDTEMFPEQRRTWVQCTSDPTLRRGFPRL
ncbi:hypothetical protein FA13DRAFT_1663448 [Coprinellus micaceus]|uniref:CENP-V/GFA domain-containing protein n=1 Tax=Coprinellus micaceus TaxID=71717 RepID=A0A4Y7TC08_COPMI|nr:hypothetical protein FA13DRAFT_1663448 [Coprinellus micaceus]